MTDKAKLLPCPFCGGTAQKIRSSGDERDGYADHVSYVCSGCGCCRGAFGDSGKGGYADNSQVETLALAAWNTRAPADDVRAVGEEPVAAMYEDGTVLVPGDCLDREIFEIICSRNTPLYRHPQRPVAPQCSEVTSQCSEHLRTQAKLFPNSVVYPHPPRHTGFLLPEREEPGYTLEQMQAYVVECIKAFIKQNT